VDVAIQTEVEQNKFIEKLPTVQLLLDTIISSEQYVEAGNSLMLLYKPQTATSLERLPPPLPPPLVAKKSQSIKDQGILQHNPFPLDTLILNRAIKNIW
jgi:hypothetical protein